MTVADVWAGPCVQAGPFGIREVEYRPGVRQARHAHQSMGLSLVLAGGFRERVGRVEEIATALSVVVKPAGVEHADEVGPRGARTLQVNFDADALPSPCAEPALEGWRWLHGRRTASQMLSLLRAARRGDTASHLEDRVFDALAAAALDAPGRGVAPDWLRRVRERLDDDPTAGVATLAAHAGVHPVSLSRAFRRHFGTSVSDLRRRSRLRHAAAMLTGNSVSVSEVAHAAGYADHAHLSRDFRRLTGLPPSQFRDLVRQPVARAISVQA